MSTHNLALVYDGQGRYDEAETLYVDALQIARRILGPTHPDTMAYRDNLVGLYEELGRYDDAARLRADGRVGR